jgi:hypothetical protein
MGVSVLLPWPGCIRWNAKYSSQVIPIYHIILSERIAGFCHAMSRYSCGLRAKFKAGWLTLMDDGLD